MRSAAFIAAAFALLPAVASAQPHTTHGGPDVHGDERRYECVALDCERWALPPPPQACGGACRGERYRGEVYDRRAREQRYYRDYYRAPQYGYTYGSARGRGYGYSYGDYRGPRPYAGEW